MELHRAAREFYVLAIDLVISAGTPPEPEDWEASFDGGLTWTVGTAVPALDDTGQNVAGVGWLLAGPDVDDVTFPNFSDDPTVELTGSTTPLLRLADQPEIVIRDAPGIRVT